LGKFDRIGQNRNLASPENIQSPTAITSGEKQKQ